MFCVTLTQRSRSKIENRVYVMYTIDCSLMLYLITPHLITNCTIASNLLLGLTLIAAHAA